MARKPEDDPGAMAISKAQAANAVPFSAPTAPAVALRVGGGFKSLTVKLEGELYAALSSALSRMDPGVLIKIDPLISFLPIGSW
jgi:hypothetical protein